MAGRQIEHGDYARECIRYHVESGIRDGKDVIYTHYQSEMHGLPLILSFAFLVPRGAKVEKRIAIAYDHPHNKLTTTPQWIGSHPESGYNRPIKTYKSSRDQTMGFLQIRQSDQTSRLTAWTTGLPEKPVIRGLRCGLGPKQNPANFCAQAHTNYAMMQNAMGEYAFDTFVDDESDSVDDIFTNIGPTKNINGEGYAVYPVIRADRPEYTLDVPEIVPDDDAQLKKHRGIPLSRGAIHHAMRNANDAIDRVEAVHRKHVDVFRKASSLAGVYNIPDSLTSGARRQDEVVDNTSPSIVERE